MFAVDEHPMTTGTLSQVYQEKIYLFNYLIHGLGHKMCLYCMNNATVLACIPSEYIWSQNHLR